MQDFLDVRSRIATDISPQSTNTLLTLARLRDRQERSSKGPDMTRGCRTDGVRQMRSHFCGDGRRRTGAG